SAAGLLGSLFFFQAEDGIRDGHVTGVQTCALPILITASAAHGRRPDTTSRITAASIISRSASGSAILPKRDSTCQRRARNPSIWSVTPATPKRIPAAHVGESPDWTISATKTGIRARRPTVSALGSCASGA